MFCTENDVCTAGTCGGDALDCPGDQCNDGFCDEANDTCAFDPAPFQGSACEDGQFCSVGEFCNAGTCFSPGKTLNCNDVNPCTADSCDNDLEACVFAPATVVSPNNMQGWGFFSEGPNATNGMMVVGPADPPLRTGSALLPLDGSIADGQDLGTLNHPGVRLDEIVDLSYGTYRSSVDAGNNLAIALQLGMDYDLTDGDVSFQGRLVFEPYHTFPGGVPQDTWQTWDPTHPDAMWWATGAPGNVSCPHSDPCTWTEVLTLFSDAGIHTDVDGLLSVVLFKAGSGWPDFDGNVDAFTFATMADSVVYDFEPDDPCDDASACTTDTCSVDTCENDPITCDDTNSCTDDTCDPGSGCVFDPVPQEGETCDDADACTTMDACAAGVCTGGAPPNCDDGNVCTDDDCDSMTGCSSVDNTDPCDDGVSCTESDVCAGGACGGTPNHGLCTDGFTCTTNTCHPLDGCLFPLDHGSCDDGVGCTADACDPANGDPMSGCLNDPVCELYGRVVYNKVVAGMPNQDMPDQDKPVQDVMIDLTGASMDTTDTDSDGQYAFVDLSGLHTVTPSRTAVEDAIDIAVGANDATLISRRSVGAVPPFTPKQVEAGDVSDNGTISAFDAALVAQRVVDLIDGFAALGGATWFFMPPSEDVDLMTPGDGDDVDFCGVIYGDVNMDWSGPTPSSHEPPSVMSQASGGVSGDMVFGEPWKGQSQAGAADPDAALFAAWQALDRELVLQAGAQPSTGATIYIAQAPRRLEDGSFEMVLGLSQADGILGLDLGLVVDPAVTIESMVPVGLAQLFALHAQDSQDTRAVSMYSPAPMQGTGEFLVVRMRLDGPLAGLPFELDAEANEGAIGVVWAPGTPGVPPGLTRVGSGPGHGNLAVGSAGER
jgi:hypothetical protein